ncbi:putative multiple sugar transport system permease protein [Sporobacter termitidis DSM 10068]|uniref:Xylose transport system permease protein XylH n=1 Tax=Sporobacter termitidis DSM 10068 TaxID=1123282 RepID=A0A1M5ZGH2_9FIRM|nr:sugar ABC transporter permease [Sporobacter termitidis]SHI23003.1 putative multiple sugar transport system permease protein [Sporobacter termitidis DSM 10068]
MKASSFVKKYTMSIALVVVFVFFTILTEGRLVYAQNISNLLLQNAYVLVMACGMLLCILTGGNVDLSVGSTLGLVAAIGAQLMDKAHMDPILTIVICLAVSVLVGVWQGFWIGNIHIPPFIATLAGMFLFRGLQRVLLDAKTVSIYDNTFLAIFSSYITIPGIDGEVHRSALIVGILAAAAIVLFTILSRAKKAKKGYDLNSAATAYGTIAVVDILIIAYSWELAHYKGIPVMVLWILLVVFLYAFITSKTAFGRHFYAVGGNEKATKLSGIDTKKVYFAAYCSMSILAGFSGLLMAARIGSVSGDTGYTYEMDAIGACFIGGASAYGGSGTIPGVIIGAILLGVINQGMSIYGLDNNWQYVVKGIVLMIAVVFDVVSNKKTGKAG